MRVGRVVKLKPGCETEYKNAHMRIWPEVSGAIKQLRISNYSIFFHQGYLFSYYELPDGADLEDIGKLWYADPVCSRWEAMMDAMQEAVPDSSSEKWVLMEELFHID